MSGAASVPGLSFTKDSRPQVLITVEEVSRRLSLSERQVQRIIKQGHIESVHIGRSLRIPEVAVERYIMQLRSDPFRNLK